MRNDLGLEELRAYLPPREEPPDFDAFWQDTLAEAQSFPLNATFTPVDIADAMPYREIGEYCRGHRD